MIIADLKFECQPEPTIVSLVPSQTELLFDLGLEKNTLGITKFCVHPPHWRLTKTIIGGTKNLKIHKIKMLKPQLIIANKEENIKEQVDMLATEFPVFLTDVKDLASALQMITDIGQLTGTQEKALQLKDQIKNAFKEIVFTPPIAAAYLIWRSPYMTVGGDTFIHDMMHHSGFNNVFADKKRYPVVTIDQIKNMDCKLLMLSSEPFHFKQKHLDELKEQLPKTEIILVNGEMFSWYGTRLLQAAKYFNALKLRLGLINTE